MNLSDFATPIAAENGFIKASFGGFAGSGKTRTACEFIIGCYKKMKCTKPILIIDNEKGSRFLIPFFKQAGIECLLKETVALADILESFKFINSKQIDFLFIDSLTKVWYQYIRDYRKANNKKFMTLQDWGKILPSWQEQFADEFVNIVGNCVFTGRGGFTYDVEENEETHKKDFIKSGVKMKMAGETPFEPDINIWMELCQDIDVNTKKPVVWREAMIMKDRSALIDGKIFKNPKFKDFEPVVDYLLGVEKGTVSKCTNDSNLAPYENYNINKTNRQIKLEEIQAEIVLQWPSQKEVDKTAKVTALDVAFGTKSWTAIENMKIEQLNEGYQKLVDYIKTIKDMEQ